MCLWCPYLQNKKLNRNETTLLQQNSCYCFSLKKLMIYLMWSESLNRRIPTRPGLVWIFELENLILNNIVSDCVLKWNRESHSVKLHTGEFTRTNRENWIYVETKHLLKLKRMVCVKGHHVYNHDSSWGSGKKLIFAPLVCFCFSPPKFPRTAKCQSSLRYMAFAFSVFSLLLSC